MHKKTPQEFIHQNPECEKIWDNLVSSPDYVSNQFGDHKQTG